MGSWLVVSSAGYVAFAAMWTRIQDLCGIFDEVMLRDPRGRAQKLLTGQMLIDDYIMGGVTVAPSVAACRDKSSSIAGIY